MFPEYFVLWCTHWQTRKVLVRAVAGLKLSGSGCEADGNFTLDVCELEYESDRKVEWGGVDHTIFIGCLKDDWLIYGKTEPERFEDGEPDYSTIETKVMWRNPYSDNLPLPPKDGWEPADELAHGDLEIEYIYPENAEEE